MAHFDERFALALKIQGTHVSSNYSKLCDKGHTVFGNLTPAGGRGMCL